MSQKNKLTSRQRVLKTLNHEPVDRVAVDLGGNPCSGAQASVIAALRESLGLNKPGEPIKVWDIYQMLGEVQLDLIEALELDIFMIPSKYNLFGFENKNWKPWTTSDGTNVLVPEGFNTTADANGDILLYPQADSTAQPSGRMPKGGYYFDSIIRQQPIDESKLNPEDNLEEFKILTDEDLRYLQEQAEFYYNNTDLAISAGIPGAAFGDIALVPAPFLKNPKGIRDIEEWYISTLTRQDYITEVFSRQAEICIENMKLIYQAVGDKVQIMFLDGADLASQNSLFCSPEVYEQLYMPHAKKLNTWIHENTSWKTIKHSCGACEPLIGKIIEAGYDILNPIQISADGMDPELLVDKYGDDIVFWGGGVDTQKTLPFGTPEEVAAEVKSRVEILSKKNGYIFNNIHNMQCNSPIENVLAMYKAVGRNLP